MGRKMWAVFQKGIYKGEPMGCGVALSCGVSKEAGLDFLARYVNGRHHLGLTPPYPERVTALYSEEDEDLVIEYYLKEIPYTTMVTCWNGTSGIRVVDTLEPHNCPTDVKITP